jgi:Fe-Mn family superoxide dismutase
MKHELEKLPYDMDALEPQLSRETLEFHYGKHHKAYVDNLNKLVVDTTYEKMSLDEIVRNAESGAIFNNAAQAWNHAFYWKCLRPAGGNTPSGALAEAITRKFGSLDAFKKKFTDVAVGTFGSGWAWLVLNTAGELEIVSTSNAGNPMTRGMKPLLTADVWEHAYYIDYRNARAKYVESMWEIVNWDFVATNYQQAVGEAGGKSRVA